MIASPTPYIKIQAKSIAKPLSPYTHGHRMERTSSSRLQKRIAVFESSSCIPQCGHGKDLTPSVFALSIGTPQLGHLGRRLSIIHASYSRLPVEQVLSPLLKDLPYHLTGSACWRHARLIR